MKVWLKRRKFNKVFGLGLLTSLTGLGLVKNLAFAKEKAPETVKKAKAEAKSKLDGLKMAKSDSGPGKGLKYVKVATDPKKKCIDCALYNKVKQVEGHAPCLGMGNLYVAAAGSCTIFAPRPS